MDRQAVEALQTKYPILRFFTSSHLPEHLQAISHPLGELAYEMASHGGAPNAEVEAGLRKLLEAKDCFVRADSERFEELFAELNRAEPVEEGPWMEEVL